MSWDLNQDELRDKFNALPTTQTPDVGLGHNFVEGAGKMAMKIAAESARAVQFAGAVVPIYQDWMTDKRKTQGIGQESAVKTVTAQERYFKSMADGPLQSAVDFWTPKPFEVGTAGEVVGSLLGMMPLIMAGPAGPSMAVGATMMSQGQNLVDQGAPAGKAAAVGTVQGLGLGLGIMAPILGRTLLERVLVGGAGFNVVQGAVTRGVSGAILEGEKASENFHAFSGKDMFIDALAGSMFGVGAHLVPAQRAQGEAAWKAISEFLGEATPTQKAAAATLLDHLHITTESLPGAPVTPADREVHIQRMAQAINDLANDRPVDVENIVKDAIPPETVGDQGSPAVNESLTLDQRLDALAEERNQMADARQTEWENSPEGTKMPRSTPIEDAIAAASSPSISDFDSVLKHIKAAIEAGRIDVAQALVERMERAAQNAGLTPGVPEGSPKYEAIKTELERLKAEATAKAERLRAEFEAAKEASGIQSDQLPDAGNMVDVQTSNQPRYNPDLARIEQDTAIREAIQEHAKTVAAEEGIPQIPDRKTIAQTVAEQMVQAGRPEAEANAGGLLWQTYFDNTARVYGKFTGQQLFDRYMKGITGELTSEAMLAQKSLLDKMKDMQPQVESAKAAMDKIIQDQRELEGLRAAMRDPLTGKIYTGWSHQGAIATVPQWKPGMPTDGPEFGTWGRLNAEWDRGTDNTGFIDRDGKFISRTEAEKRWNVLTMEDVRDAKKKNGTLFQGAVPWYHSELERQIGTAKMGAASPKDWKNYIKGLSNKGVKADEVKWTGLEEWLDLQQGKVTKEQIQQYMKDGGVKVEEVTLGASPISEGMRHAITGERDGDMANFTPEQWMEQSARFERTAQSWQRNGDKRQADKYFKLAEEADALSQGLDTTTGSTAGITKFATYQLPGGENYRELLLTLPTSGAPRSWEAAREATVRNWAGAKDGQTYADLSPENRAIFDEAFGDETTFKRREKHDQPEGTFKSSHFDQPNILSHIRFNERTDADGKKVLFIEEIQSDWAQKGKKEGFRVTPEREAELRAKIAEIEKIGRDATPEQKQQWADAMTELQPETMQGKAPQAPFVGKTEAWVGLSLKRMIRYAAENGFDRVAWTNGEQQVSRYREALQKAVDTVKWEKTPEGIRLVGSKDGRQVVDTNERENALSDSIGKAMADRIINDPSQSGTLEGKDITISDTGMSAFYDKIVPNIANDILKKLGGGRVGEVTIKMDNAPDDVVAKWAEKDPEHPFVKKNRSMQPGFDITPSMREKAMETQALFQPDRGALQFDQQGKMAIALLKSADPSTFLHESGHFFLEVTNDLASQPDAPAGMKQDMQTLYSWFGLKDADTWNNMTLDEKRPYHEQFARGFERYLRDGQAPTPVLKGLFQRFRDWLKAVYQSASQLNVEVSDQVRAVMDRMLAEPQRTEAPPEATRSATPPPPRGGVGEPMGEASVLTEVQQVREEIMAAEHTARQRWGDAIVDALYEKYAPHLEDAGQLRGMSAIMESLAEDAKPAYLMKTMGPRPKEPQSLIAAIKELGGINTSMRSDIAGPDKKGVPVSLFRKAGKNVDELALLLQEKGFLNEADIANESDNGGINKLMEMIQDEIAGSKHYSERDATQAAALREHDQFMESIDGKGESASTHFTPEEWATIQREVIAEGMAPTAKNVVDADAVSIAMQIDEARVERAAITAADDFDFMAEVREIIDGYKPQPDATAAERSAPTAAEPGTPSPAGQEANAPGADRNAGNQGVDPLAASALRFAAENPDMRVVVGEVDGKSVYQPLSQVMAEVQASAALKRQDASLFQLAAQCLLGGGR